MAQLTESEKQWAKKVREFISRTNCDLSTIGNSKAVHYSNVAKLKEFILEERGTISMRVMGRIDVFMKQYKKQKNAGSN